MPLFQVFPVFRSEKMSKTPKISRCELPVQCKVFRQYLGEIYTLCCPDLSRSAKNYFHFNQSSFPNVQAHRVRGPSAYVSPDVRPTYRSGTGRVSPVSPFSYKFKIYSQNPINRITTRTHTRAHMYIMVGNGLTGLT